MSSTDQDVDFAQGGDDGENTDLSIQPVGYSGSSEFNDRNVFNRIFQNLRRRTERLRSELRDAKYVADADRGIILWSPGTVQLVTDGGGYKLIFSDQLTVTPALSPGLRSGGRAHGARLFVGNNDYAGTYGVNDVSIVASSDYTGQRGYADGETLASAGVLSVGGNNITVELEGENRAGGAGSIAATVTGTPRRHVKITYGTQAPGITVAELIAAINGDETLFGTEGTFGLRHLIRASSSTAGASTTIPDFARTKLKGGYDAEAFTVSAAQAAAFFSASSENLLLDGDGLAIGFPAGLVESGTETFGGGVWSYLGGRRQSLIDAPTDRVGGYTANTGATATYGNLFNTARQPELIPNAIPIGHLSGDEFVFVDGTRLKADTVGIYLGESYITVDRIADTVVSIYYNFALATGTTGASIVGYGGSAQWHAGTADDGTATLSLPGTTVEAGLDAVVTQLSSRTLNSSGSRRVGGEALTGTATSENTALSLTSLSVRGQLALILNGTAGLNQRVYESGHRMVSANPLYKDFTNPDSISAGGGGIFLQSMLRVPANLYAADSGTPEQHSLTLQALVYDLGGDDNLDVDEVANFSTATALVFSMDPARFTYLVDKLPLITRSGTIVQLVVAKITGLAGCVATDGLYLVRGASLGGNTVSFRKMDNTAPDFTGMSGPAAVTFYNVLAVGNDQLQTRVRAFHYAPTKPFAVVGVSDVNSPILETYIPAIGQVGTLTSAFYANRAMWLSTRRTFGGDITRATVNILGESDKQLLDGLETGAPADASTGHHHASLYSPLAHLHSGVYTRTHFWTANTNYPTIDLNVTSGDVARTSTTVAPTGYTKVAVIVTVIIISTGVLANDEADGSMRRVEVGCEPVTGGVFKATVTCEYWQPNLSGAAYRFRMKEVQTVIIPLDAPSVNAGSWVANVGTDNLDLVGGTNEVYFVEVGAILTTV